jgi:hypothetical protein
MNRLAVLFIALAAVASAVPAAAQTPPPRTYTKNAMSHKAKPMMFSNPANPKYNPGTQNGTRCISGRGANAAAQTIDPVTGKPRAATFVSIPLGSGGGSVASNTAKAQQAQACSHPR